MENLIYSINCRFSTKGWPHIIEKNSWNCTLLPEQYSSSRTKIYVNKIIKSFFFVLFFILLFSSSVQLAADIHQHCIEWMMVKVNVLISILFLDQKFKLIFRTEQLIKLLACLLGRRYWFSHPFYQCIWTIQ